MRIQRLAGDKQMHDLGSAFDDRIDAYVAQDTLDRPIVLPAGFERALRFISLPAADLQRFIGDEPAVAGAEIFGDGRLETDILLLSSAMAEVSQVSASCAKVWLAIYPSFNAMLSCSPMLAPIAGAPATTGGPPAGTIC